MTISNLVVLVEEQSMEETLRILLPKMLGDQVTFQVYTSNGKQDLLANLGCRLRGYRNWLPDDWRILVLVDRDDDDCAKLKQNLERLAHESGLATKSQASAGQWQVVNRLCVEELEAWFFGDMDAVRKAFPRVPTTVEKTAAFRNPDTIKGGTWQSLERILKNSGYFKTGYRKLEAARLIARHMTPEINRSQSFRLFRDTIREIQGR